MVASPTLAAEVSDQRAQAARYLPPWTTGELPAPPEGGWRLWVGLIGPGVVLAGTSIGSGEWLFGPAVTAQYGAGLLWLALVSILLQAFCNLAMMRYAVYSGEPIIVGGLRTWPGPLWWMAIYAILDVAAIWPYNASNAAVPLAAVFLGRLPQTDADQWLVKALGFTVFLLAFVPLIFGGTVYRMLEKIMTAKLVLVLGYLSHHCPGVRILAGRPGCGDRVFPVRHHTAAGSDERAGTPFHAADLRSRSCRRDPRNLGTGWTADRRPFRHGGDEAAAVRSTGDRSHPVGTESDPQ